MSDPDRGMLGNLSERFLPGEKPVPLDLSSRADSDKTEKKTTAKAEKGRKKKETKDKKHKPRSTETVDSTDTKIADASDAAATVLNPTEAAAATRAAVVSEVTENPDAAAAVAAAVNADGRPAEQAVTAQQVAAPGTMAKIGAAIDKFFADKKHAAVAGFVGGVIGRAAIKNVVRAAIMGGSTAAAAGFGSALIAGAVGGLAAGGVVEGIRRAWKERTRFNVDDALAQFESAAGDTVKQAALAEKISKYAKDSLLTGDKEKIAEATAKARAFLVPFETALKKGELKGDSEKNKILLILRNSRSIRKEIPADDRKAALELITSLKFSTTEKGFFEVWKDKEARGRIYRAAGKGAAIGALGGVIGGAVSEGVSSLNEWFHGGVSADHIPTSSGGAGGEVLNQAAGQVGGVEVPSAGLVAETGLNNLDAATKDAVEKQIMKELLAAKYESIAEHGNGVTHLARKSIHDFLVNTHWEGNLTPAHLVYMEDSLVKDALKHGTKELVQPGQKMEWTGQQIADVLQKAEQLDDNQLKHLNALLKTKQHFLSEKTLAFLNDRTHFANPQNASLAGIMEKYAGLFQQTADGATTMTPEVVHQTATFATSGAETQASQQDSMKAAVAVVLGVTAIAAIAGGASAAYSRRNETQQYVILDRATRVGAATKKARKTKKSGETGEADALEMTPEERDELWNTAEGMFKAEGRMGAAAAIRVSAEFVQKTDAKDYTEKMEVLMTIAAENPELFAGLENLVVGSFVSEVAAVDGTKVRLSTEGTIENARHDWRSVLESAKEMRDDWAVKAEAGPADPEEEDAEEEKPEELTTESKETKSEYPITFVDLVERFKKEGYPGFEVKVSGDLGNEKKRRRLEPVFAKAISEVLTAQDNKELISEGLRITIMNRGESAVFAGGTVLQISAKRGLSEFKKDLAEALNGAAMVRDKTKTLAQVNEQLRSDAPRFPEAAVTEDGKDSEGNESADTEEPKGQAPEPDPDTAVPSGSEVADIDDSVDKALQEVKDRYPNFPDIVYDDGTKHAVPDFVAAIDAMPDSLRDEFTANDTIRLTTGPSAVRVDTDDDGRFFGVTIEGKDDAFSYVQELRQLMDEAKEEDSRLTNEKERDELLSQVDRNLELARDQIGETLFEELETTRKYAEENNLRVEYVPDIALDTLHVLGMQTDAMEISGPPRLINVYKQAALIIETRKEYENSNNIGLLKRMKNEVLDLEFYLS